MLIPASIVLRRLHDEAPADHFTLGWLMGSLRKRSFGIMVIGLIALAWLEEDGLLLAIALLAGVVVLTVAFFAAWETILGAEWIGGLW
jgi:hypothetical protein